MFKQTALSLPLYSLIFLCGCSIFSAPEVANASLYDLGNEKIVIKDVRIRINGFTNLSGAGTPMLIREKSDVLSEDDDNRFILLPEVLIRRKFTEIFTAPATDGSAKISGRLWRFEIDKRSSRARMVMEYELILDSRTVLLRHDISHPVGQSGRERAAALEKCVINSAHRLAGEITTLQKTPLKDQKK